MKILEARPLRHERSLAFVTRERGCFLEDVMLPVFDRHPRARALRTKRVSTGMSLGVAASRAGIRAAQWSGIEQGRLVPETESGWSELEAAIS